MDSDEKRFKKGNKSFKFKKIKIQKNINKQEKKISKNITNIFSNIIKTFGKKIFEIIEYLILSIPFYLMDYYIREETEKITNFKIDQQYSYTFSYTYIIFYVLTSKALKGIIGKIYYIIIFIFYFILFLTNIIYYSFSRNFFYFKLLSFANEGGHFITGVIRDMDAEIWIKISTIIFSFIVAVIIFRNQDKNNFPSLIVFLIALILIQSYTAELIGHSGKKEWDDFGNPKSIFNQCTHPNKCMKIAGFYKYIEKDFLKTYLNIKILLKLGQKEEMDFLNNIYKDIKMHDKNEYTGRFKDKNITYHPKNEYTGIFKNKNLIFVQLEGMDNRL